MNFIDNIEIKNFKSIRHQKIEGCKRVNVFIGYPNVGKSNILEALSAIQFYKSNKGSFHDFCRYENVAELFFEANIKEQVKISFNNLTSVNIKYGNEENMELFTSPYGSNIDISGIAYEPSPVEIEILKYQFTLNHMGKNIFTRKHLQSPFGDNLFLLVGDSISLRKDFNSLLNDYGIKLLVDKVSNSLRLIKEITEDSIFQLSYSLLADTLQRLFFYKVAIQSNQNSVLLFEEPEAHMFPPYISKFTSNLINDENSNQFFITTHSPFVLNDLISTVEKDELAIYIISYEKEKGETLIHKMNDTDIHEAYQFGYDFFMNIDQFIPQKQHG